MDLAHITDVKQIKEIRDGYFLVTTSQYLDPVQKSSVIHKYDCERIKEVFITRTVMPTSRNYFHIKSDDTASLEKYDKHKTCNCFKNTE